MEILDLMQASRDISILLPTRGRQQALRTSISSLLDNADNPDSLEILLAFDRDDPESSDYFQNDIAPIIDDAGAWYTVWQFERLGYIRLNEYVNYLAGQSQAHWLMFWGDDAVMRSRSWDQRIREVLDFRVLRIPTHNQHPYAIFPIVPRAWYQTLGHVSAHQLTDTWVSQIAYLLGIMRNIDVEVIHDRFDITGNNNDETYKNRPMLEGNRTDPRDFNHPQWARRRQQDCKRLVEYLREQGQDISWWDAVCSGQQDPWAYMLGDEQDPNHQVKRV
jgi:hypothetical protein